MKKKLNIPSPNNMFDRLVRNAIDFMEKSIKEIDEAPKYSVINFCSAVELFLKARLLAEHWTLIVPDIDNKKVNLESFKAGDFQSVNLKIAIERLRNIAGVNLTKDEERSFENVKRHRNKLVHFFHPKYIEKPDKKILDEMVPEQWSAWFYLNRLLLEKWNEHFSKYQDDIKGLNYTLIFRYKEFLKAKYEALKIQIEEEKRNGTKYTKCTICGYDSARVQELDEHLFSNSCVVCLWHKNILNIPCPECGDPITILEFGEGECEKCHFKTDIEFLISEYGPGWDPDEPFNVGYCAECECGTKSVIPFAGGYLCLSCLTLHDSADHCGWCNELNAGKDLDGSYFTGCVVCEGKSGWDND